LSTVADIRVSTDTLGRMKIFTAGGTELLEGTNARTITFDDVTGTLTADGIDITPSRPGQRGFEEGEIAGQIALLGEVLPQDAAAA
jgi:flagellar hook-associated protein 1 FlgK